MGLRQLPSFTPPAHLFWPIEQAQLAFFSQGPLIDLDNVPLCI
jgi:hypothetical protein